MNLWTKNYSSLLFDVKLNFPLTSRENCIGKAQSSTTLLEWSHMRFWLAWGFYNGWAFRKGSVQGWANFQLVFVSLLEWACHGSTDFQKDGSWTEELADWLLSGSMKLLLIGSLSGQVFYGLIFRSLELWLTCMVYHASLIGPHKSLSSPVNFTRKVCHLHQLTIHSENVCSLAQSQSPIPGSIWWQHRPANKATEHLTSEVPKLQELREGRLS